MPSTRQLATIMFTDIVGYTALMGKDEKRTFDILIIVGQINAALPVEKRLVIINL
jgi:hypothetical protein